VRGTLTYPLLQVLADRVVELKPLLKLLNLLVGRLSGIREGIEVSWWELEGERYERGSHHRNNEIIYRTSSTFGSDSQEAPAGGVPGHHPRPHSAALAA